MVRPYGVKDRKLKRRREEESAPMVDEEEEVEVSDEGVSDGVEEGIGNGGEIAEPEDERRAEVRGWTRCRGSGSPRQSTERSGRESYSFSRRRVWRLAKSGRIFRS